MELLLGALVVALAIGFVVLPLFRSDGAGDESVVEPGSLNGVAARRQIYREVLELEFDHRVGKLTDQDYRALSAACLDRAAALVAEEERQTAAADARVEQEIAEMRRALRGRVDGAARALEPTER